MRLRPQEARWRTVIAPVALCPTALGRCLKNWLGLLCVESLSTLRRPRDDELLGLKLFKKIASLRVVLA